jgi:hypothetical protein
MGYPETQNIEISNKIMKDMYAKLWQSTVTYYSARGAEIHETREVDGINKSCTSFVMKKLLD